MAVELGPNSMALMPACGDYDQCLQAEQAEQAVLTFSTESSSSVALLYLCMRVQALLLTSASTMVLLRSSSNSARASSWGAAEAGPGMGHLKFPPPAATTEHHAQQTLTIS